MHLKQPLQDLRREISFEWIGGTALRVAGKGFPIFDELELAGINIARSKGAGCGIGVSEFALMCSLVFKFENDFLHGVADGHPQRSMPILGLRMLMSSRTLRSAITDLSHFYDLVNNYCRIDLVEQGGFAEIRFAASAATDDFSALIEEMMLTWLHAQFCYVTGTRIAPLAILVKSRSHPNFAGMHPFLNCPVAGASYSALRIPIEQLSLPIATIRSDQPISDALFFWLKVLAEEANPTLRNFAPGSVSGAFYNALLVHDRPFSECCDEVGLSETIARSELLNCGDRFRDIRKAAFLAKAVPMLIEGQNLDDIAHQTGHADARSVRRALTLATGLSIKALRQSQFDHISDYPPQVIQALKIEIAAMELLCAGSC